MKTIIPILFALFYFTNLSAQTKSAEVEAQNQPSLSLHYHAYNLLHGGVELGYEAPLLKLSSINKKDNKRWYQLYIGPSLGIYNFRGNHTGITLGSDLGLRTIGHKGLEIGAFAGLHYVRAINANETFELGSNGTFEKVNGAGHNYIQWRAGFGLGKNFLAQAKPFSVSLKIGVSRTSFPSPPITPNIWIGAKYYLNKK